MEFLPKDFDALHYSKIKDGLSKDNISSQYFICFSDKMLFIKRARKGFKIVASCQCGFEPMYHESHLEVIAFCLDISQAIDLFYGYCNRLLSRSTNELY